MDKPEFDLSSRLDGEPGNNNGERPAPKGVQHDSGNGGIGDIFGDASRPMGDLQPILGDGVPEAVEHEAAGEVAPLEAFTTSG